MRKKERNRTANSKNESNVRPTQLVRLQSKEKIYLFYVFNILLPGIIKQESKKKRIQMFYLKPIIGEKENNDLLLENVRKRNSIDHICI